MLRPFRITLDRFINRRRSKDIYETGFFLFFHIFPAFLQNRLYATLRTSLLYVNPTGQSGRGRGRVAGRGHAGRAT